MKSNIIFRKNLIKGFEIILVALLLASVTSAAKIEVCKIGTCDYSTIQDAISAASSTDTIEVHSGTYYENVNVNKQLTLKGVDTGAGMPVVNAGGSGSAIKLSANGIVLEGFRLINSGGGLDAGISIDGPSNYNLIRNNTASSNNIGILLNNAMHNTLIRNNASNNNEGIVLDFSYFNTLSGNIANSNNYNGISLVASGMGKTCDNNNISGNTASYNKGNGIFLTKSSYNLISGNIINSNSNSGINLSGSTNGGPGFNKISANIIISNGNAGITLTDFVGDNLIYNNYFNNPSNAKKVGEYGITWNNTWNITKEKGTNIIGGAWLGGNYWSDYSGMDTDGDGLGDTVLPYDSSGGIINGGDYLPLSPLTPIPPAPELPTISLIGLGVLGLLVMRSRNE